MLKVGVTGGIGSGKSTVCQVFETLGIPVLYADETAKYLMGNDAILMADIKRIFGDEVYDGNKLNRGLLADTVFTKPEMLAELNSVVHPAVLRYSSDWVSKQTSPYIIKEAAIFFESKTHTDMDVMVGVFAPRKLRILRAMNRDNVPQEKILQRMSQQMGEDEKMALCDHVITNDDVQAVLPQVLALHEVLLQKAAAKR